MSRKVNYILTAAVIVLAALCVLSISAPLRFQHEQRRREAEVKARLLRIGAAEYRYRMRHGTYCGDWATLIHQEGLDSADQYVPYSNGKRFKLRTATIKLKSGKQRPAMECGATYEDYLQDLDENSVSQLIERTLRQGSFPGLKIGDITIPDNYAGNWQ